MNRTTYALLLATTFFLGCPSEAAEPTDSQIKQTLIDESVKAYKGACPCPYSVDANGKKCAEQSAYRTPGGVRPKCYASDISASAVAEKRKAMAATPKQ